VEAPSNTVLIARDLRDRARIVGTLTLVVFRIPSGVRAGSRMSWWMRG
jgi:hypothetical protein